MVSKKRIHIFKFNPDSKEHLQALRELVEDSMMDSVFEDYLTNGKSDRLNGHSSWVTSMKAHLQKKGKVITYLQKVDEEYSGFITVEPKKKEKKTFVHDIFVRPEFRETYVEEYPKELGGPLKKRREQPLMLAAKLLRYVAKTHGFPLDGIWLPPHGERANEKYGEKYNAGYFRLRGMKARHRKKREI
ncbi:MAG: hypothetical protein J7L23_00775 [Candidatus Diapherotrites archaeon]|nr:hypothetical protein [Candidatus Diapherotrites archaeon]